MPFAITWQSANAATVYGLPAGHYQVQCKSRSSQSPLVPFSITDDLTTRVPVPMDPSAKLDVHVEPPSHGTGTLTIRSLLDLEAAPILREITRKGVLTFGLPEGRYQLHADFGTHDTEHTIKLAPGDNFVILK